MHKAASLLLVNQPKLLSKVHPWSKCQDCGVSLCYRLSDEQHACLKKKRVKTRKWDPRASEQSHTVVFICWSHSSNTHMVNLSDCASKKGASHGLSCELFVCRCSYWWFRLRHSLQCALCWREPQFRSKYNVTQVLMYKIMSTTLCNITGASVIESTCTEEKCTGSGSSQHCHIVDHICYYPQWVVHFWVDSKPIDTHLDGYSVRVL